MPRPRIPAGELGAVLTPEAVATKLNTSRRHLDRVLPHGQGVGSLIVHFRLRTARALMEIHPHITLDTLAKRSGFSDRNTFRAHFMKVYSMTPSEARRRLPHTRKRAGEEAEGSRRHDDATDASMPRA